jgi:valyl-tRNA synthetase
VNLEDWPKPDAELRNKAAEEDFETLFKCVSLVYAARQSAGLKRRWPLSGLVIVGPKEVCNALRTVSELLIELTNVQAVEYATEKTPQHVLDEKWATASEGDIQVFLNPHRDEKLLGAGLMRDLARRVQALRKELGYMPTDVLEAVHIAELDDESIRLLEPYVSEMKNLVRSKELLLQVSKGETSVEWHESQLDDKKVSIAISGKKAI